MQHAKENSSMQILATSGLRIENQFKEIKCMRIEKGPQKMRASLCGFYTDVKSN